MKQGFNEEHWNDENGNPAGGCSYGIGFTISWQNGPLGRGDERKEPNGAFVEDVIAAVAGRLEYYQKSNFYCEENAKALGCLYDAIAALNSRTQDRETRGVECISSFRDFSLKDLRSLKYSAIFS